MNPRQSRALTPLNKPVFRWTIPSSPGLGVSAPAGLPGDVPQCHLWFHVGPPGTFPGPRRHRERGQAAILLRDLPSEGRKRPPRSPINHRALLCSTGQMKLCRAPGPCVPWRGESFSSHAAAKHLPVSPGPGEAAPLLFILPPGILTAWARGCGARGRPSPALPCPGLGDLFLLDDDFCSCASASPLPCVSLFPRNLPGKDAPLSTFGGD